MYKLLDQYYGGGGGGGSLGVDNGLINIEISKNSLGICKCSN